MRGHNWEYFLEFIVLVVVVLVVKYEGSIQFFLSRNIQRKCNSFCEHDSTVNMKFKPFIFLAENNGQNIRTLSELENFTKVQQSETDFFRKIRKC